MLASGSWYETHMCLFLLAGKLKEEKEKATGCQPRAGLRTGMEYRRQHQAKIYGMDIETQQTPFLRRRNIAGAFSSLRAVFAALRISDSNFNTFKRHNDRAYGIGTTRVRRLNSIARDAWTTDRAARASLRASRHRRLRCCVALNRDDRAGRVDAPLQNGRHGSALSFFNTSAIIYLRCCAARFAR